MHAPCLHECHCAHGRSAVRRALAERPLRRRRRARRRCCPVRAGGPAVSLHSARWRVGWAAEGHPRHLPPLMALSRRAPWGRRCSTAAARRAAESRVAAFCVPPWLHPEPKLGPPPPSHALPEPPQSAAAASAPLGQWRGGTPLPSPSLPSLCSPPGSPPPRAAAAAAAAPDRDPAGLKRRLDVFLPPAFGAPALLPPLWISLHGLHSLSWFPEGYPPGDRATAAKHAWALRQQLLTWAAPAAMPACCSFHPLPQPPLLGVRQR
jgi:hypothetical protein